jgi:predicted glutamine amidotransferase
MCQLLGMNGNVPTDICFSFKGFACRGGRTDHHSDGWGIAFFEGQGCRLFLDYLPSATSPDDRVAVIVTEPLTANEDWRPMQPGELLCFRDGLPHAVIS